MACFCPGSPRLQWRGPCWIFTSFPKTPSSSGYRWGVAKSQGARRPGGLPFAPNEKACRPATATRPFAQLERPSILDVDRPRLAIRTTFKSFMENAGLLTPRGREEFLIKFSSERPIVTWSFPSIAALISGSNSEGHNWYVNQIMDGTLRLSASKLSLKVVHDCTQNCTQTRRRSDFICSSSI